MLKTTIKKALGVALALTMMPCLSATALADEITVIGGEGADVNAMFVPDPTIEAKVSWGNMNFTFSEKDNTWSVENENDNRISVQNLSPHRDIAVSVQYEDSAEDDIDSIVFMPSIFSSAINYFNVKETPGSCEPAASSVSLASRLGGYDTANGWPMFTSPGVLFNNSSTGADQLGTSDFSKIGTLKVTIAASA